MRSFAKVVMVVAPALVLSTLPVQAAGPFQYTPITPCRIVDTRSGGGGTMASLEDRAFSVQGVCGVPAGAKAVALNVTVVATQTTSAAGFLTLYPTGVARPNVSTINFVKGDVVANGAIVPLGTASTPNALDLHVFAGSTGTVNVILDVSGYFQ
jgi:hypothetical protein